MSGQAVYGIDSGAQSYMRAHYERTKHLPAPNERYRRAELHEDLQPLVDRLVQYGAIHIADRKNAPGKTPVSIYKTDERAYRVVDDYHKGDIIMPCGHRGFKNRGDHYECSFEECEEHFTRAEVEEAIDSA